MRDLAKWTVGKDKASVHIDKLTVSVHWPLVLWNKDFRGVVCPTAFVWRGGRGWWWTWAAQICLLGFGLSAAWKHTDNPNYKEEWNARQKE